jgi:tetraacyldisaccharide 4'-kinase
MLYDLKLKTSKSYSLPVICVGNLSVGGTGKTPMIEYLIRLLKDELKIATLSRGYKRKIKGFQIANTNSSADTIGDEPFQFFYKFKDKLLVAVDADRQRGIEKLVSNHSSLDVVLLDDAFQHRKVRAGLNILLTTYNDLYVNDYVLPTGNLREPKQGANRAQIIVVTKCPTNLSEVDKEVVIKRLKPKPHQNVFFSSIRYSDVVVSEIKRINVTDLKEFTLVTGIANANPLINFLTEKKFNFEHLNFKDHHDFSEKEISILEQKQLIITTEKDFMRLKQYMTLKDKLYYLPIEVEIKNSKKFNSLIRNFVNS